MYKCLTTLIVGNIMFPVRGHKFLLGIVSILLFIGFFYTINQALTGNPLDGHTLEDALDQTSRLTGQAAE